MGYTIFYTGHDEHSSMCAEQVLIEEAIEHRTFDFTCELPDSLSTIDESVFEFVNLPSEDEYDAA
jgi:hypothetical protein